MAFNAGSITSTLGLDISPFTRGMLQAESIAKLFPATVTNFLANPLLGVIGIAKDVGRFITDAMKTAGQAIVDNAVNVGRLADNMGELAQQAGVNVGWLSQIGRVASDSGSSVEGFAESMVHLNRRLAELSDKAAQLQRDKVTLEDATAFLAKFEGKPAGVQEAALKIYDDMIAKVKSSGSEFTEFEKILIRADGAVMDTVEAVGAIADAFQGMSEPKKAQFLTELMSRGGAQLIPFFNLGREGIRELMQLFNELGDTIDADLARAGDKFATLGTIFEAAIGGIQKAAARPILQGIADHYDDIVKGVRFSSSIIRDVIAATWDAILNKLRIPAPTTLLDYLEQVAGWVRENPGIIQQKVTEVIDWIVGKFHQLVSGIDYVIDHATQFARVLEVGAFAVGMLAAASLVGNLTRSLLGLSGEFGQAGAAAAGAGNLVSGALAAGGVGATIAHATGSGTGGTIGAGVGSTVGFAAGTSIGASIGASIGGTLGNFAGPIGGIIGAAFVGYVGERIGHIIQTTADLGGITSPAIPISPEEAQAGSERFKRITDATAPTGVRGDVNDSAARALLDALRNPLLGVPEKATGGGAVPGPLGAVSALNVSLISQLSPIFEKLGGTTGALARTAGILDRNSVSLGRSLLDLELKSLAAAEAMNRLAASETTRAEISASQSKKAGRYDHRN